MNMTRRFFIGGAAACGAFSGCRFLQCGSGFAESGKPNLTFGVVSDIHITKIGATEEMSAWGNNLTFRHTLEWFRDQGADAVMVVGDMADNGMVEQMQAVAQAWYAVFPNDHTPDGRKVERLFVLGNHDYHGYLYGKHARRLYEKSKAKEDFATWSRDHVLRSNIPAWWRNIFHEDYSRFYARTVKGYTFLGQHWDDGKGMETAYGSCPFGVELKAWLDVRGKSLDPMLPFFYFQHPHPKDTCYGPWAWGHDSGLSTKALSAYANAIAFSGHSHYSLTDERSIWQGDFTSIGTSSLRYTGLPYDARKPFGYENTSTEAKNRDALNALKVMAQYQGGDCRQGMLWRVYDDHITVQRREFLSNLDVGGDWVLPLPSAEPKPFAFASRAAKAVPPAFPAGATIKITKVSTKPRAKEQAAVAAKPALKLSFPAALATAGSRPHEYCVTAYGTGGKTADFYVLAEGFNQSLAHPRAKAESTCVIALDRLPANTTRFSVSPMDCWWNKGKAIEKAWKA